MIKRFSELMNESNDYKKFQDFGCNYISEYIEKNPEYDNEDFFNYVTSKNKADRDYGELQDVCKSEIERLAKEYKKDGNLNEDAATLPSVGSGTAVGSGTSSISGNFTSAAGVSASGGDSASAFSSNSSGNGMGAIKSAQPSNIPGDVAGSTKGSGDITKTLGTFTKNSSFSDKKKKKKKKNNKIYNTNKLDKLMVTSIKKFEAFNNKNNND